MNRTIIVVHSVHRWLPQTETWLYNQVSFLPPEVETHIVCERTANLEQFSVPNIHRLSEAAQWRYFWDKGLQRLRLRRHSGFLVEQAKRHHAQILHSHFGPTGWANIGAAKKAGLKHVVSFYGQDVNRLPLVDPHWRQRYKQMFRQIDLVLCEGPNMARCIVGLGCPQHKIRVQHLGVRVDEIRFRPREWNSDEHLRVLICAAFREKKGIPYALEALGRLQNEFALAITIIGDANAEPRSQHEKKKILNTIAKHGLESKVRMLGYQPHENTFVEAYKHHIFLSPSITARDGDTEGGAPVTIIEMAATGMPVVSTQHCDIPYVIQHGATGLLAGERDVEELTGRLEWLARHPNQWQSMAEAARRNVEAEFNADTQGQRLATVYQELVD